MAELPIEEPNPFDELTGGEIAAFIYKKCGEDNLRQLLAVISTRESVEEVADELSAAGLRKAARITAEVAATKPPMTDLAFCPYPQTPENAHNIACWLRAQQQRQRKRELERQQRFKTKPNKARKESLN